MEHIDTVAFVKAKKQDIFDELDNLPQSLNDATKKQKIDELFLKADQVKKYVHQHLPAMIAYEIRVCNNLIKEIDARISRERDGVNNNKPFKFSFSLKQNVNKINLINESSLATAPVEDQIDSNPFLMNTNTSGLTGLSGQKKVLNSSEIDFKEIILDSLTECTIYLEGAPSALRLINIRSCTIFSGPVSGSVFIINCHQCKLHIVGQQLRIHDTTDCDIYQHVSSRTIIENCSSLRFGCHKWKYDQLEEDFQKAGIDIHVNNWTQIDDFDCLANPSPNWSLLE